VFGIAYLFKTVRVLSKDLPTSGPKFRIHFHPAAGRANYDRVIAALNDATWGLVPIVVT
jgi:hypothetical protein